MKRISVLLSTIAVILIAGCNKPSESSTAPTEQQVLTDFANVLATPNYKDIQANANAMNMAIITLSSSPTDANLATAQLAWRNTRKSWESCEGWLFGPVEDDNYDPSMDSWPVDKVQLDSLLASSNPLTVTNIDSLDFILKGFHAIEYVIFGAGGQQAAAQITPRQMTYIVSMSQSLYNTTTALRNSWDTTRTGNFTLQLTKAGTPGYTYFNSKKQAFLAIAGAMADICDEVGTNKMQEPLGANPPTSSDSTQDESSFSHNSTTDFTNNIQGIYNAYYCTYNGVKGHSLHDMIRANSIQLDNNIASAIQTAISSFSTISPDYEVAIYTQTTQIRAIQANLANLKSLLDNDLPAYINVHIKD